MQAPQRKEGPVNSPLRLRAIASHLDFIDLTPEIDDVDPEVHLGYASDLLSDVLAHAPAGAVLVTAQAHLNVLAVASHVGLSAVVFTGDVQPAPDVLLRAVEEGIPSFRSAGTTFDVAGWLHGLGLRGGTR
jgi:hypothetical protein